MQFTNTGCRRGNLSVYFVYSVISCVQPSESMVQIQPPRNDWKPATLSGTRTRNIDSGCTQQPIPLPAAISHAPVALYSAVREGADCRHKTDAVHPLSFHVSFLHCDGFTTRHADCTIPVPIAHKEEPIGTLIRAPTWWTTGANVTNAISWNGIGLTCHCHNIHSKWLPVDKRKSIGWTRSGILTPTRRRGKLPG